ncbi:MAG: Na+/H+ antiporter subunit E [Lachnospiraceae bacterium]|nr:Na+/H+ antiporter subunit E [Lachnospiraceae bacterium]
MYILFFVMWILFNGSVTLEIVIFGLVIAAAIYWFVCRFMDFSVKKDIMIIRQTFRIIEYLGVLVWEILKANVVLCGIILNLYQKPEPVLVTFHADLKTETARAVLANSITLTPGTITVNLEENEFTVHCLDKSMARGLDSSVFVKLLEKMEKEAGKRG